MQNKTGREPDKKRDLTTLCFEVLMRFVKEENVLFRQLLPTHEQTARGEVQRQQLSFRLADFHKAEAEFWKCL